MTHDNNYGAMCAELKVKAVGEAQGLEEGQFTGYASVFGNVDSYGDIVDAGAFTRTLAEWTLRDDLIPLLWGHDFSDPFSNIGHVIEAREDEKGLLVTCQVDLENPTGAQVYRLLKGRRVSKMSFAYRVNDAEMKDDGYHLKDLSLFEVSVVPMPANQEASILTVKAREFAAQVKAGKVISATNLEKLETAIAALQEVLDAATPSEGDDGKAKSASEGHSRPDIDDDETLSKSTGIETGTPLRAYADFLLTTLSD